jgi:hypothetical protein
MILYVISKRDLVCGQRLLLLALRKDIPQFVASDVLFQAFVRNMEVQEMKAEEVSSEAVFKQSNTSYMHSKSRDNAVGIATGHEAGRPRGRSSSPDGGNNFHFSMSSRLALGSPLPPIQWIPVFFPRW